MSKAQLFGLALITIGCISVSNQAEAADKTGNISWTCPDGRDDGTVFDCLTELKFYTVSRVVLPVGEAELTNTAMVTNMDITIPEGETHSYSVRATDIDGQGGHWSIPVVKSAAMLNAPVMVFNCFNCNVMIGN